MNEGGEVLTIQGKYRNFFLTQKSQLLHLGIPIVLILIGLIVLSTRKSDTDFTIQLSLSWLLLTIAVVYLGNYFLNRLLDKAYSWKKNAVLRLTLQLIFSTLFSLLCFNLLYYFLKIEFTDTPPDWNQYFLLNIFGAALIIPTISIFFGVRFVRALQKSELQLEKIQKENARSQMISLKNHLDPHFLFNNLNILSSLIDNDTAISKKYLEKFAEVYRVILKAETDDLTSLATEHNLIQSYIYLLKIRFEKGVEFDLQMDQLEEIAIPPLSLQMLIENAIKHNITSQSSPLKISILTGDKHIKVCNNYQPKPYDANKSKEGTGLENIKNRYKYFTDIPVIINQTQSSFCVHLPILKID